MTLTLSASQLVKNQLPINQLGVRNVREQTYLRRKPASQLEAMELVSQPVKKPASSSQFIICGQHNPAIKQQERHPSIYKFNHPVNRFAKKQSNHRYKPTDELLRLTTQPFRRPLTHSGSHAPLRT